jgi:hypothetical protein
MGRWPGRGPFSHLPPWQRPGWLYGRGACWWLLNPYYNRYFRAPYVDPTVPLSEYPAPPYPLASLTKEEEKSLLADQRKFLENEIQALKDSVKQIEERLKEMETEKEETK